MSQRSGNYHPSHIDGRLRRVDIFALKLTNESTASLLGGILTLLLPLAVLTYAAVLIQQFVDRPIITQTSIIPFESIHFIPYIPFHCMDPDTCVVVFINGGSLARFDPNYQYGSVNASTPLPTCGSLTHMLVPLGVSVMIPICAEGFTVFKGAAPVSKLLEVYNTPTSSHSLPLLSYDGNKTFTDDPAGANYTFSFPGICVCETIHPTAYMISLNNRLIGNVSYCNIGYVDLDQTHGANPVDQVPLYRFGGDGNSGGITPSPIPATTQQFALSVQRTADGDIQSIATVSSPIGQGYLSLVKSDYDLITQAVCGTASPRDFFYLIQVPPYLTYYPQQLILLTTESRPGNWTALLGQIGGSIGALHSVCVALMWLYRRYLKKCHGDSGDDNTLDYQPETKEEGKSVLQLSSSAGRSDDIAASSSIVDNPVQHHRSSFHMTADPM